MVWNRSGLLGIFDKVIECWCWCWYGIADRIRLYNARSLNPTRITDKSTPSRSERRNPVEGDLVSIIMPTIGRDATKVIQSVLNQTYKNWELIIVQDGLEIIEPSLYWKDSRIRVYQIPKKLHYPDQNIYQWLVGPVNAINYGLSKVRGAWIARIDDDDYWSSTHLEDALCYSKKYPLEEFWSFDISLNDKTPPPYWLHGKFVGAVQTWLYRSYLKCFKCSKHSWRWRPGNNDIDLPQRLARAGVYMKHIKQWHATIWPRPGLTETGKKGFLIECMQKNHSSR